MRQASVDLGAITRNVETLRAAVGGASTMAVVKANAYGHGAVPVARAALDGGADWLGVVDLDEALELRAAEVTAPVFAWLHDPAADFDVAVEHGIDVGVSYFDQLERAAAVSGRPTVHLKVDTGLGRTGIAPADWARVFAAAAQHDADVLVFRDTGGMCMSLPNGSLNNDDRKHNVRAFLAGCPRAIIVILF